MKPTKALDPRCQLYLSLSINLLSNSSHPNVSAVKFQGKSSGHVTFTHSLILIKHSATPGLDLFELRINTWSHITKR